jgi:MEMO1 family protein
MGKIISAYIFPHPPIIIPEVGKGGEAGAAQTVKAVQRAAEKISTERPTTLVLTTPHGPVFQDYVYISTFDKLEGDLGQFGCKQVRLGFENNTDLVSKIIEKARNRGIPSGGLEDKVFKQYKLSGELDHGALVPLYFINKLYKEFKLVHISIAGLPFEELYRFGMCIADAIREMDEQVVFAASGDLSHKLSREAPYGYNDRGPEFDALFVESVRKLDVERLLEVDENLCESAGECGLRSFLMMFGALDGYALQSEVYSYEGPFGVGYSVARLEVGNPEEERQVLRKMEERNTVRMKELRTQEDPYVALARRTLEMYVNEGKTLSVPEGLPEEMTGQQAGAFVSIKKQGQLRGCIGTTGPTSSNIAHEIIQNAISAGTRDPRFDPIEPEELDKLVYSVDVLGEPEPISSMEELDVIRYGVIVRSGRRSGLLLPNLEGVDTPEQQVSITLQKAGIRSNEEYKMERFEVIRHK